MLKEIFSPAATALVGASPDFGTYSGKVMHYFRRLGYEGQLWPVNPKYSAIGKTACYPSLAELPGRPDHVGIAVSASRVLSVLEQAVAAGARVATLFSAGFAESGTEDGQRLQDRIGSFCRETGLRVLGPNCNGLINWRDRYVLSATSAVADPNGRAGNIGIVSQSGGLGQISVMWRAMQMGLGVSLQASCGNECDMQAFDIASIMVDDPGTDIILLALESIRDGERMFATAEKARAAGKPVLALKLGRNAFGARAAASHTAALAGADAIHDTALAQAGIVRVDTAQELCETAMLLSQRRPSGQPAGMATVSISGGSLVVAADNAEPNGLVFPTYQPDTLEKLARLIPGFIAIGNPTDLSPQAIGNGDVFRQVLEIIAADPNVGALMPVLTMSQRSIADAVCDFADNTDLPTAIVWTGGCTDGEAPAASGLYKGVPLFRDIEPAMKAFGFFNRLRGAEAGIDRHRPSRPQGINSDAARAIVTKFEGNRLAERVSKGVLREYGLSATDDLFVRTVDEAAEAFKSFDGPAVLKIESPEIVHKSDIGGVALDLHDEAAVRGAFREMSRRVADHRPDTELDGMILQRMVPAGVEILVGFTSDPVYGPVLALGPGGTLAEYSGPPVLRLPPFGATEAMTMIDAMPARRVLDGVRGRPPCDLDALADFLVRFSWLARELGDVLTEADVNPLILGGVGEGCIAVDAFMGKSAPSSTIAS